MSDMKRICVCGHENGNHAVSGPCLGATPGDGDCDRGCKIFVMRRSPGPSLADERREEWAQEDRAEEKKGYE